MICLQVSTVFRTGARITTGQLLSSRGLNVSPMEIHVTELPVSVPTVFKVEIAVKCLPYIQGVTGGTDQTSGECSLGQTIPI